jgi:cobalamin 5'-phosphate synthase/cobalamin synthase
LPVKKNPFPTLNNFLTAVSFLTVIPVSIDVTERKNALAEAMVFFPLVGLGMAGISLGLVHLLEPFLSERLVNILLVLFPIVLSGGLHIDGLADFFDGFFQGKNRDDILRVMKDPHIGVWGTLAVVFFVLLKWELLALLPSKGTMFLSAITLSRWSHVFLSYLQPYARGDGGLGDTVAKKVGKRELWGTSVFALSAVLLLNPNGLWVFLGIFVFVLGMGRLCRKKIGGITGDTIGATGEMSEIVSYILFLGITKLTAVS